MKLRGRAARLARRAHNPKVVGSNPTPATNGSVAQLVEHRTENPCVGGSSPSWTTIIIFNMFSQTFIWDWKYFFLRNKWKTQVNIKNFDKLNLKQIQNFFKLNNQFENLFSSYLKNLFKEWVSKKFDLSEKFIRQSLKLINNYQLTFNLKEIEDLMLLESLIFELNRSLKLIDVPFEKFVSENFMFRADNVYLYKYENNKITLISSGIFFISNLSFIIYNKARKHERRLDWGFMKKLILTNSGIKIIYNNNYQNLLRFSKSNLIMAAIIIRATQHYNLKIPIENNCFWLKHFF